MWLPPVSFQPNFIHCLRTMKRHLQYIFWTTACAVTGIVLFMSVWLWSSYTNRQRELSETATHLLFEAVQTYARQALPDTPFISSDSIRPQADGYIRPFSRIRIMHQMDEWLSVDTLRNFVQTTLRKEAINLRFSVDVFPLEDPEFSKGLRVQFSPSRMYRSLSPKKEIYAGTPVSFSQVISRPLPFNPDQGLFLCLHLHRPFWYIVGTLKWQIITAILLTTLTLGCFAYMLILLYRQKKLASMKNDFVNNMTHELKTPVATVSAAVEALDLFGAISDVTKAKQYLSTSRRELQHLSGLIEKVMDIAAHDNHDITLCLEPASMEDLLNRVADRYRGMPGKTVHIDIHCSTELPIINVDRLHLGNAFGNLLDNSIKYGGGEVYIKIACTCIRNKLTVLVSDNGPGINPRYQAHIFERFFRVPHGDIHQVKGHGLGLAYTKQVIGLHQGTVSLENSSSSGTTFKIIIPIKQH